MNKIYCASFVSLLLLMSVNISAQEDEELMMRPNPEESRSQELQKLQRKARKTDPSAPYATDGKEKMGLIIEDKPPVTKSPSNLKDGRETMGIVIEDKPAQDIQK